MSTSDDTATWTQVFWTAVEHAGDSVLVTDSQFHIVYANPGFTRLTGYSASEVMGHTPAFLQGPQTERAVIDRLHSAIDHGEVFEGSTVNYRKDGTPFDITWTVAPVTDGNGAATHYVTVQREAPAGGTA